MLQRLHSEVTSRLKQAYAPKSQGVLGSALAALARFAESCPERELFRQPAFHGDITASAHNEWTFILFVWYMLTTPSQVTGKPVALDTVRTYVSLLKGYLSFSYSFDIIDRSLRLKRLYDSLADERPAVTRKKRRAFRRRHLRKLGKLPIAKQRDVNAVNDMAAAGTAWETLARGGELCPSITKAKWRKDVQPTRGDLTFHRSKRSGKRHAILMLRPLKKKGKGHAQKIPQYIAEHDGGGSCVYTMLRRLEVIDPVPESERASTPLFRRRVPTKRNGEASVRHMTVSDLRKVVKSYARLLGFTNMHEWGAHSPRIGGATDLASTGKASELLLKAKGRWSSEIGQIYARMTQRSLLAASRLMQKARGRDLEEIMPTFTQPA